MQKTNPLFYYTIFLFINRQLEVGELMGRSERELSGQDHVVSFSVRSSSQSSDFLSSSYIIEVLGL